MARRYGSQDVVGFRSSCPGRAGARSRSLGCWLTELGLRTAGAEGRVGVDDVACAGGRGAARRDGEKSAAEHATRQLNRESWMAAREVIRAKPLPHPASTADSRTAERDGHPAYLRWIVPHGPEIKDFGAIHVLWFFGKTGSLADLKFGEQVRSRRSWFRPAAVNAVRARSQGNHRTATRGHADDGPICTEAGGAQSNLGEPVRRPSGRSGGAYVTESSIVVPPRSSRKRCSCTHN